MNDLKQLDYILDLAKHTHDALDKFMSIVDEDVNDFRNVDWSKKNQTVIFKRNKKLIENIKMVERDIPSTFAVLVGDANTVDIEIRKDAGELYRFYPSLIDNSNQLRGHILILDEALSKGYSYSDSVFTLNIENALSSLKLIFTDADKVILHSASMMSYFHGRARDNLN